MIVDAPLSYWTVMSQIIRHDTHICVCACVLHHYVHSTKPQSGITGTCRKRATETDRQAREITWLSRWLEYIFSFHVYLWETWETRIVALPFLVIQSLCHTKKFPSKNTDVQSSYTVITSPLSHFLPQEKDILL